jgi:membrane protease YdiL (CAAX protease family)
LFGLCHWLSASYGVLALIVGMYLGGLFLISGSLIPPMIAHGLYDFVALIYLVRRFHAS